jgi:hypothetical protein
MLVTQSVLALVAGVLAAPDVRRLESRLWPILTARRARPRARRRSTAARAPGADAEPRAAREISRARSALNTLMFQIASVVGTHAGRSRDRGGWGIAWVYA